VTADPVWGIGGEGGSPEDDEHVTARDGAGQPISICSSFWLRANFLALLKRI
jgi:hypothetical protein